MTLGARPELLDRGIEVCERRGYETTRPTSGREPDGLAEPGPAADALVPAGVRPVAVEPLSAAAVTPTNLLSRLWDDHDRGRAALFVVPDGEAERALSILTDPPFVAAEADGRREFYAGPDRVPLAEGGYALARPSEAYRWGEEPAAEARPADPDATGDRLVLRAGNGPIVVLSGVDALDCPPRDRVPFSYGRGADKRIRVRTSDGDVIGSFAGVRALRDAGFEPIPMPLVPEHVLGTAGEAGATWALVTVDGDDATIHSARGARPL
jgi:hypothetical protein